MQLFNKHDRLWQLWQLHISFTLRMALPVLANCYAILRSVQFACQSLHWDLQLIGWEFTEGALHWNRSALWPRASGGPSFSLVYSLWNALEAMWIQEVHVQKHSHTLTSSRVWIPCVCVCVCFKVWRAGASTTDRSTTQPSGDWKQPGWDQKASRGTWAAPC